MKGVSNCVWNYVDVVINCSSITLEHLSHHINYLHISIQSSKSDRYRTSRVLPDILTYIWDHIQKNHKILIHHAEDISIALCISLSSLINFFDTKGYLQKIPNISFTKKGMRDSMYLQMRYYPHKTIPKVMLTDLNRFFMAPQDLRPINAQLYWERLYYLHNSHRDNHITTNEINPT